MTQPPSPRRFRVGPKARIFSWYDLVEADVFECSCGWHGTFDAMARETFRELVDGSCPSCERMLVVRGFPTDQETIEAADRGDSRARGEVVLALLHDARIKRASKVALRPDTELPVLPEGDLCFDWDFEEDETGESWTVIPCGDVVMHRELAYHEGHERFNEVKAMLKERFESRFAGLYPTPASKLYLYGDDIRAHVDPD
jgi:hypothetical protein